MVQELAGNLTKV